MNGTKAIRGALAVSSGVKAASVRAMCRDKGGWIDGSEGF